MDINTLKARILNWCQISMPERRFEQMQFGVEQQRTHYTRTLYLNTFKGESGIEQLKQNLKRYVEHVIPESTWVGLNVRQGFGVCITIELWYRTK
jgi:hypothetical protein